MSKISRYDDLYQTSIENSQEFWLQASQDVHWFKSPKVALDSSEAPFSRWFPDGLVNTCYNALDIHVESGRGDQTAVIYDSPVTQSQRAFSYGELLDLVSRFAGGLKARGVQKGDRVLIYMPMIPEAVVGMLACARLGAVHSVVFGGFASNELATRIDDAKPKAILTASCGIETDRIISYQPLLEGALGMSTHSPDFCVWLEREQQEVDMSKEDDVPWIEIAGGDPVECTSVASTDPLYVLYTSGTTGVPKGVVRDNGGHLVALKWSLRNVYGMVPGETFWAASDIGWVVGHSYIVYAPLFLGCTTVLYEGKPVGTPDAGAFWRVISEHGVSVFFTAPTAFRAIKREDPAASQVGKYDLTKFRTLFLAGERADSDTVEWAEDALGIPVIDHWWQTETGWPIAANCMGIEQLTVKRGSPTRAVPGYRVVVLDDSGVEVPAGETGSIAISLPLPPGCLSTLWNNDEGFEKSYLRRFPGFYETADAGHIDKDGYIWIMSRTDDIINVAGHRLSTGGMEEVLSGHSDVAECAVLGVGDSLKGQVPLGLVVLKAGVDRPHETIVEELIKRVRENIGPVAAFKTAAVVDRLPKTRSGKILRGTMRSIADSQEFRIPATIDDPDILGEIREVFENLGYARPPK